MTPRLPFLMFCAALGVFAARPMSAALPPKKLLVVSVTTGFRHSSIPLEEKALKELGEQSGAFTVDFVEQPPGQPVEPKAVKPLGPNPTDAEKAAFQAAKAERDAALQALAPAKAQWMEKVKTALAALAPAALEKYDGVVFASTTGELPLPDPEGFLNWIKAGHAFIGIHSASDTLHHWPGYVEMLGGEFWKHGWQVSVDVHNLDAGHPAAKSLPAIWTLKQEEIYNFKTYDPAKVHELLALDKSPLDGSAGHFPLAWCKAYGQGRVFYTALGHREDLWDADPALPGRINSPEMAEQYRAHVLGGILWALGLEPGAPEPK